MIGDEHIDAARMRRGDTFDAGDAVVDGDDQRRPAIGRECDDLRRHAVAVFKAVGHQEFDAAAIAVSPRMPTAHAVAPSAS